MDSQNQDSNTEGFLVSFNLMVIGGLLMLGCIVSVNKLINHHLHKYWEEEGGILTSIGKFEADAFRISSLSELYLTWFFFLFFLVGLILVIVKLVKTWRM
jgi:hypothetical protein